MPDFGDVHAPAKDGRVEISQMQAQERRGPNTVAQRGEPRATEE
jgi:hypothetical protein